MTTRHYTVRRMTIHEDYGVWSLPVLYRNHDGTLTPSIACIKVIDGVACDARAIATTADEIRDELIYKIERGSSLRGWGNHDCEKCYSLGGMLVNDELFERFAEWTGLRLPVTA